MLLQSIMEDLLVCIFSLFVCSLEGAESSPWVKEWLGSGKAGANIVI